MATSNSRLSSEKSFVKDFSKDTSTAGTLKTPNSFTNNKKLDKAQCPSNDSFSTTKAVQCHKDHISNQHSAHTTQQTRQSMQESPAKLRGILRSPRRRSISSHCSVSPLSSRIFSPMVLSTVCDYFSIDPIAYTSPKKSRVRFSFPESDSQYNDARRRLDFSFEDDCSPARVVTHHRSNALGCMNDILFELDIHDYYPYNEKVSIPTLVIFRHRNVPAAEECRKKQLSKPHKVKSWSPYHQRKRYPFTV